MLKDLFQHRDKSESQISDKVKAFLIALDAQGHHAPSVSDVRRCDQDITHIGLDGDNIIITYSTTYSGNQTDYEELRVPVATIEDPSIANITAYIDAVNEKNLLEVLEKMKVAIKDYEGKIWSDVRGLKECGKTREEIIAYVNSAYDWKETPKA